VFLDATVFLGMHHRDDQLRQRSLGFFRTCYGRRAWMNYEQIGICDAVIWRQHREIQDLYYPFMDRLHSDMQIVREGYQRIELDLALGHPELEHLLSEQALLAAQILARDAVLATHDPALHGLACMRSRLWDFTAADHKVAFPAELQALYETSCAFVHTTGA
jgi:hypothetical protein